jgi:hypothetical protein
MRILNNGHPPHNFVKHHHQKKASNTLTHTMDIHTARYNGFMNTTCPPPPSLVVTPDYSVLDLPIIIPCIGALIIGLFCSKQIRRRTHFATTWLYSISFFCFGVMMTSAMILHCFVHDNYTKPWYHPATILLLIDGSLTSFISVAFMLAGLADLEILDPNHESTKSVTLCSYVVLLLGYTYIWLQPQHAIIGYTILYVGVISVAGLIYLITQVILLHHAPSLDGVGSLTIGGAAGAIGIGAISIWSNTFCDAMGPVYSAWWGPNFIWYAGSDIAVYFIYTYVLKSQNTRKQLTTETSSYETVSQNDDQELDYVIEQNYDHQTPVTV